MCLITVALFAADSTLAQDRSASRQSIETTTTVTPTRRPNANESGSGRIAGSLAGRPGQRKTDEQFTGIKPMDRIDNRIPNRVQLRYRNRIGPNFDPDGGTSSPFADPDRELRRRQGKSPR